ncbi:hypothetical protein ABIF73_000856 [Bradyrhizobium japonicum]|uniref:hypothetical protein n=1 Tax=Bradyrhizobium japonicum TaxID=375 RepID=UPI0033922808
MNFALRKVERPAIHLWIYNHPFYGISDQIEYFVQAFQQHGYPVTVGREPATSALNVVIENFSVESRNTLIDFCTRTRKRVAVIMTEHIDFVDRRILIHGDPLWSDNDYMHPATQVERLKCLMSCQPYIKFFMVLGDLPELRNFSEIMLGAEVRAIPFPAIEHADLKASPNTQLKHDLLFTGYVTEYRERVLSQVTALGLSVLFPRKFVSRKQRDFLNLSARIVLNIPQRANWRWLSLMRIIAALRCGRATISLGTSDKSRIAACTYQLNIRHSGWRDELKARVVDWAAAYEKMYEAYCQLAIDFEQEHPFPHDMMEFWAITDRVRSRQPA